MTDPITTTVTWDDLIAAYDDELQQYREAYADLETHVAEEYDTDLQTPSEDDTVTAIQQQAARYDQAVQQVEKRQHVLETLRDPLGEGAFEVKMLSGQETIEIEKELRMEAQNSDIPINVIQTKRNQLTVDAATVDAPEGVPREDDSPVPSECPNALTLALWEQVERFNNAGSTDFRPEGCGTNAAASPAVSSPTPSSAPSSSSPSAPSDDA